MSLSSRPSFVPCCARVLCTSYYFANACCVCARIRQKQKVSLPSAADMFDSVEAGAASFMAAPVPSAEVPLTTPKRKKTGDAGSSNNSRGSSSSKKNKTSAGAEEAAASTAGEPSNCRRLIPPQMSRPNIVTEDSAMWSSDAEVKRRRQVEAERRGGAGKGKGGKDSLTFKQREKVGY